MDDGEGRGLGGPWQDYLARLDDDRLVLTKINIYRMEPRTQQGYIEQVSERIDEAWLQERFGGGVFALRIETKGGPCAYIRDVRIAGEPKFLASEGKSAVIGPVAGSDASALKSVLEMLDKTVDRLERLQNASGQPSAVQQNVVDIMADAARKGIEIASNKQPEGVAKDDPLKEKLLNAAIERMLAPAPAVPAAPLSDPRIDKLIDAAIQNMLNPKTPNKSLLEELKSLGEVRELLGWGEAGGGGRPEHWTTALIHKAPEVVDKLADLFATRLQTAQAELQRANVIANANARVRQAQPLPAAAAPPAPGVQTSTIPEAPPPDAGPLRMTPMGGAPAATQVPHAPIEVGPIGGIDTESPAFVDFVKRRVVHMVKSGQPGGSIVAFLEGNQQGQFIEMLVKFSAEDITRFLSKDPVLKEAVEDPEWQQVLEEAKQYVKELQEEVIVQ